MKDRPWVYYSFDSIDNFGVNSLLTPLYETGGVGTTRSPWAPCTTYNGLYGETSPERGTAFSGSDQVYQRVGFSLIEVYLRVGKSVITVCKKHLKGPEGFYG